MSCSTSSTVTRELVQEPRQRLDGLRRLLDRQALRRLVEQQHLGLLRHGHGDLEQPLVAVAEQAGRPVCDMRRGRAAPAPRRPHCAPRAKTLRRRTAASGARWRACAASMAFSRADISGKSDVS